MENTTTTTTTTKLDCSMEKNCKILMAAARLHNFIIEEEEVNYRKVSRDDLIQSGHILPLLASQTNGVDHSSSSSSTATTNSTAATTTASTTPIGYMAGLLPCDDIWEEGCNPGTPCRDRIVSKIAAAAAAAAKNDLTTSRPLHNNDDDNDVDDDDRDVVPLLKTDETADTDDKDNEEESVGINY
eukprot:scaffold7770_cov94-Cylindrotheca_fusiformis.AAC.4